MTTPEMRLCWTMSHEGEDKGECGEKADGFVTDAGMGSDYDPAAGW